MDETYIITEKAAQEVFASKDINISSWGELALAIRQKVKRLERVAEAFERYRDTGEPFIGEKKDVAA